MIVFAMAIIPLQAQSLKYSTMPLVSEIKTLQTIVDGDIFKLPVVTLDGDESLEISFDYLSDQQPWLTYSIVHCDAEWKKDDLSEMDYTEGFFPVRITDVRPSFNTFIPYFHYTVSLPNDETKLTASGNYAVLIHPEDDEDEVLAVATFSVSEQLAYASGQVTGNTDIDYRKSHQQLIIDLSWSQNKLPFVDAASQLRMMVRQNRRDDTCKEITVPTRMEAGHAIYEHNKNLIFEAGNNYRRFEFTDVRYATFGIDQVLYEAPYYYAQLTTAKLRNEGASLYDQDQNGRYLVRALHVDDEKTEAEYFKATFMLKAPMMLDREGVYLQGDFSYGQYSDEYRMNYDKERNIYWKDVLLKQGAYNYQYLVGGKTSAIEGNYYETENEYDIYIYYHPNGARYDRLLGVAIIK